MIVLVNLLSFLSSIRLISLIKINKKLRTLHVGCDCKPACLEALGRLFEDGLYSTCNVKNSFLSCKSMPLYLQISYMINVNAKNEFHVQMSLCRKGLHALF